MIKRAADPGVRTEVEIRRAATPFAEANIQYVWRVERE
jgi:hypothetical protein